MDGIGIPPSGPAPDGADEPSELAVPGEGEVARRDPSEIRDPLPQPLISRRRLVIVALLAVAVGCLVVAARSGGGTERTDDQPAIASFTPAPGSRVIRQSTVGVILEPGHDGRLVIDGVAIPEAQMEGAIAPGSEAFQRLSEEDRAKGPRPNNKEQVLFRPGPGRAITEFRTGQVEITVRYWKVSEGESTARSYTYAISTI